MKMNSSNNYRILRTSNKKLKKESDSIVDAVDRPIGDEEELVEGVQRLKWEITRERYSNLVPKKEKNISSNGF